MGSCDCSFSLVSTNSQALVLSYSTRILWTSPLYDSCWLTGPLLVCHTYSALSSSFCLFVHIVVLTLDLFSKFCLSRVVQFSRSRFCHRWLHFHFCPSFGHSFRYYPHFFGFITFLYPFHIFVTLFFLWNVRYLVRFFDFHISSRKLICLSRFFLLCAPFIIFMTLSFTHVIHPMIREFLFPPCPVWSSNPFSMFARSLAFPNSLIFASFAFSVLLEFFFSSSCLTYASPNFSSPPWCLQLWKF